MVDVIDSLEASGNIVRRRNPADRRAYALELTARGRALFTRAERAIDDAEKQAVARLEPGELDRLNKLLLKLGTGAALTKR